MEKGQTEKEQLIVNTSLRLSEKTNKYIKEKAQEIGASQNAFTAVLIDLGIKVYECEVTLNLHQK